ncbi:MAG: nitrite reductase [Proteobacteria bacterium]|nr:nitrite reductase [Pseudomonadota bacterium]MBU1716770.1 nitrite reductase [Pseudomonadota bacterium]
MASIEDLKKKSSLTILLPGGELPLAILHKVNELCARYRFGIYLSTVQNLRLYGVDEKDLGPIKSELAAVGAEFKGPGKFPLPKICIGSRSCNLGIIDTMDLSRKILDRFKGRENVKPKFKIAISGCPAVCSDAMLTDIGLVATRVGFDIYAGGKGGPTPKIGRRIVRGVDEEKALMIIEELVDFHDRKTEKKQRMAKLLDDPEFPYPDAV